MLAEIKGLNEECGVSIFIAWNSAKYAASFDGL